MKKAKKYLILAIVWAVVSVSLFFAGRGLYTVFMKKMIASFLPDPSNGLQYATTVSPALFHPEAFSEEELSKRLVVRGVLSDLTGTISSELAEDADLGIFSLFDLDESVKITRVYAFASEDQGCNDLSFGTWKHIFRRYEEEEAKSSRYNSFALMNIERAIEEGYWEEIQLAHDTDKSSVLRLDCYAIRGVECVPIDMTLSASSFDDKSYHPHDVSEFDSSWTICDASDVYVFNPNMESLASVLDRDEEIKITDEIKEGRDKLNSIIQHADWNPNVYDDKFLKDNTLVQISYRSVSNPKGTPGTYLMAKYLAYQCPDIFTPICRRLMIAWTIAFWSISLVAILIVKAVKKNNQPEENI